MLNPNAALMEFHISRQARDFYQFNQALFAFNGNVIFADFHAARLFAQKMNDRRDLMAFPERTVQAGQINAMGLIDEILHMVVQRYREQRSPKVLGIALAWLYERVGQAEVEAALLHFVDEFPPLAVFRREISVSDYLQGKSRQPNGEMVANREILLEEMILLWLANANPAFEPFEELFDDQDLALQTTYPAIIDSLHDFFDTQPPFGPKNQNLIDLLRSPALASPHSLSGQLEFIRSWWKVLLGDYVTRLLSSLDLIKEEEKAIFLGPGPSLVYEFTGEEYFEPERFSQDRDWMPNLVMIAKNVYVWLDQLSKVHKRAINRLDLIPDETLDNLARWGISGLWLIGLWERSKASKTIKQMRGNPEAVASAYSLFSYEIANDLGGEEAYLDLKARAWQRGIRLASDMVPNHMGIDSRWLVEHPNWFVQLDYSPFPSYTFNGVNLSWDERVGIYLEDHYYDNSDAAVVFKRVDFWTGNEKYIYHGNDGTSMPWNDTAQLNFLLPEVREAVIQTILHVARKFSIIRFDAAMTLAKRHYQRLWFPEPGSGGDIPSRAEHGITKADFERAFPEEFWREVVDRVAQEVPDTLLLAEAFWLMEGYFVRTLGMHRVYNSAFMNMLRDEKNQEYRLVMKNTMEFDPEILKRYVNFMNNPDEDTAVDQFGKGDKYFGVCTMMITLPGLPMIGHGQVEGFTEKYGMEYKRAYWDETPDGYLVARHEREIFSLLRRRYLFAEVRDFLLYDFYTPEGHVNEDVYAYSNRVGDQRSLVVYHNKFASGGGWIRLSAAFPVKTGVDGERVLVQKTLGEGLDLVDDGNIYTIFRDHIGGLEYIRNSQELIHQGLYVELEAYQCHVFLDFRELADDDERQFAQLVEYLDGGGVPSIDEALKELTLRPVLGPFRELVNPGMFNWLIQNRLGTKDFDLENAEKALDEVCKKVGTLIGEINRMTDGAGDPDELAQEIRAETLALWALPRLSLDESSGAGELEGPQPEVPAIKFLQAGPDGESNLSAGDPALWGTLLGWLFTYKLGKALAEEDFTQQSRLWLDEWLFGKITADTLKNLGLNEEQAQRSLVLIRTLVSNHAICDLLEMEADCSAVDVPLAEPTQGKALRILESWLGDQQVQRFLLVHRYQGELWFNKEAFEELLWWIYALAALRGSAIALEEAGIDIEAGVDDIQAAINSTELLETLSACYQVVEALMVAEQRSEYKVVALLEAARRV